MKTTQYEEKMMKNDVTPYDNEIKKHQKQQQQEQQHQ